MPKRSTPTESDPDGKHKKRASQDKKKARIEEKKKKYAVLAVVNSDLLRLCLIPNKDNTLEEDGRITFTPEGMFIKNYESTRTRMVEICLYKSAFSYYHCVGEEVIIDLCLKKLVKETDRMTGRKVQAVLNLPHSQCESGIYGPLSIYFRSEEGLQEDASLLMESLDLSMQMVGVKDCEWDYDFCVSAGQLKKNVQQLCTDDVADAIRLTFTDSQLILENNNGNPMYKKRIVIKTSKLPSYNFHPINPIHKNSMKIVLSRPKVDKMLSLPQTSKLMLEIHGNKDLFRLQYKFEEEVGFIRFILATMISEND